MNKQTIELDLSKSSYNNTVFERGAGRCRWIDHRGAYLR